MIINKKHNAMSGHSKWSTIKHKKGATDAKRAKLFTKLQKEIMVSAKLGDANPEFNPRLRSAIIAAKAQNMPKDKIEGTIKKATTDPNGSNFEEIRYEGYGPSGVAFIVETLTDNKNRTASEVRSYFTKTGGSLGETGSVGFMFERIGLIAYDIKVASEDVMFEAAVEAGAESVETDTEEEIHEIICSPENFAEVRDALIAKYGDPQVAKLDWKANVTKTINEEELEKVERLIDLLEDNDDVQVVTTNIEIA